MLPGAMATSTPGEEILDKSRRLHARDVETFPAAHVFAHYLVVQQHHVAGGLLEFRAVALVGAAGQAVDFGAHQPSQIVCFRRPAEWTVQRG